MLRVLQIFVEHTIDYVPAVTIKTAMRMHKVTILFFDLHMFIIHIVLWHNHNNFNEHYCTCFLKSFPRVTCRYFYQQLARCLSTYICDCI